MGTAICQAGKAAKHGLRSVSQAAAGALKPVKAAQDLLPTKTSTASHIRKPCTSKKGVALHGKGMTSLNDKVSKTSKHAEGDKPFGHAKTNLDKEKPHPSKKAAAEESIQDEADGAKKPSQGHRNLTAGRGTSADSSESNAAVLKRHGLRNVDQSDAAALRADRSFHADDRMGSSVGLQGAGVSSSSFPLLPPESSAAALYESMCGDDWRLGTSVQRWPDLREHLQSFAGTNQ